VSFHDDDDELLDGDELLAADMFNPPFDPTNRHGPSDPLGAHVVNWRHLPDDEAPAEWEALRAWVEWFTSRYHVPISVIPNCWWQHGHLVEELSALHTAHTAAFDPADAGLGPVMWHERLTIALPRLIRAYGGGCNNGHTTTRPRAWDNVTSEQDWDAWTTRSHAHPGTTVPPQGRNTP
jgi:hypothetical protein